MPRAEDIAWKFVIRLEGKKWRCPYCENEYAGTVTRVKGHFRKQPKEGIASCTKVPEHISTLMELLQNQVHNKDDIAWKFVNRVGENKWRCHHCRGDFFGDLTGVRCHLLEAPNEGTSICMEVPDPVRKLMRSLLDEVAEEQSGEAHGQSSMEPKSRDMPTQAQVAEEESGEDNRQFSTEAESRDMLPPAGPRSPESWKLGAPFVANYTSDQQATVHTCVLQQPSCHWQTGSDTTAIHPQHHPVPPPAEEYLDDQDISWQSNQSHWSFDAESDGIALLIQQFSRSTNSNHLTQLFGQSVNLDVGNIQQHPRALPSLQIDPFLNNSSSYVLHESTGPNRPYPNLDGKRTAGIPQRSTQPYPNFDEQRMGESLSDSTMALAKEVSYLRDAPHQPQYFTRSPYLKETQTNDQQTPAGASSFQSDQLPDIGNSNRLQDCNQHSHLQTPMDIDPSIASPHIIDSRVIEAAIFDLQVLDVATNTAGSLSSQEMNRGSPIVNVRSIYAKDEEIRNLKRKVEELNHKEAVIKKQMEIESAASSVQKKPRIMVERWLKETERARNNFQIFGQANAETLPAKEQVETLTREVEELMVQTTLLIEARDAKGDAFLEQKLIGEAIHRNIELIWDHLKANHVRKLGIYGMGGVGKTTIMMHIHNRLLEDATFDGVAFITVSEDFSNYKLQSDISKALNFGIEDDHEKKRAAKLSKCLERKKNCVLILDDVWERLDLEEVGIPARADGFKLVLTTRSFNVCCQMQCQEKIKIKPLSLKEAESLFLEELGSEAALNLEIEAVVKSIVRECAGLPIGVIMMARSMRGVTNAFEWRDSLVKLEESSKGQIDMEKKVLMNLKFSYDRLGNPDEQQCFLSCALYPEDELIDKFELVEFFIDQGLIGGLNMRKIQYERGCTILKKLGNVCLLEDHGRKMKMHDLIRDMALHIMSVTSIVKARKNLMRIPSEIYWTGALEKVSLMKNYYMEFPLNMSPNCPKLSTLLLNGCLLRNVTIPDSFFKNLLGLKVLNLSENNVTELPNSISDLVNLRALLLRGCWALHHIPYLGKLTSLRKLDAHGCFKLEEAPKGLEMLVNLRYLDLGFSQNGKFPKGVLGSLLNLQHLEVGLLDGQDMTRLRALETLKCYFKDVDDFNKCVRVIERGNPHCYYLHMCQKDFFYDEEESDSAQFENQKRRVNILGWSHAIVSMAGECTGIFILIPRDVQIMTMTNCNGITNLFGIGPLKYLEELEIDEWENLDVLCGEHDEEVIDIHDSPAPTPTPLLFPSLRVLQIERCPKLKYLFGHGSKFNLLHLREIQISDCEEMVGIIAAVTSSPSHPLPFFPRLEEIRVKCCDKIKRAVESEWMPHFSNLRSVTVISCEKIEEIIGGPPPYVPVEEISLESLDVRYCNNMKKLFPHEWLLHLQKLQSIRVNCCKGMVEMISEAGQGQEGSIMTPVNNSFQPSSISLPKLKRLELHNIPQLKSICEVPISCNSMEDLRVYGCPKLKGIPLQLRLREIEELPHVWVEDEEKWKMLMWDHPDTQAILQPYLQKGPYSSPNVIELFAKRKKLLRLCS